MTTSSKTMTADELWRMPPDHMRHELVNGELTTMAPAGFDHGAIGIRMAILLGKHIEAKQLGVVVGADTGFVLRRNPDTVRAPDAAFVSTARIPASGRPKKFFEGAPDLAVEVLSPSDTVEEVDEKIADYLDAGTSLVWIINPKRKSVTVYKSKANPIVLHESDLLDGENIVPEFTCKIVELFSS
jgi:Uma2 family endonuclease